MQTVDSNRPPWINDRANWGRIRLTRRMWHATYLAVGAYLNALWDLHRTLPNPSPESRSTLDEIREMQKVMENLKGLGEEKNWSPPGASTGNSRTE